MFDALDKWTIDVAGTGLLKSLLSLAISIAFVLVLTGIAALIIRTIGRTISNKTKSETIRSICKYAIAHKLISKITLFIFFFLILTFAFRIPRFENVIGKISMIAMVVMTMSIISAIMDVIIDFYATKEMSKSRPIKGPLQIVKIVIFIVLSLIAISILINQNPIVLISGIGAFTAILTIVFKDALLGFISGIQITSEGLLEIGDYIKIPSAGVEGTVTDISLITIRITTFNNTVVTVPAYTLVSSPFINWHDTINDKKRQVARTIYVDGNSIRMENGGTSTNLTRYRQAIADLIDNSEHVRKEFAMQVRTASSQDGFGIPVEILYTIDITDYDEYCAYCSYVSEMAYAMLDKFDLKAYQPGIASKR